MLLLLTVSGAMAQVASPQGTLFERVDGSHGYIVSSQDRLGQWQVAFGSANLWLELVDENPQLRDPDLIQPGDTLNVPPSLNRLFTILSNVDAAGGPMPAKGAGPIEPEVVIPTAPDEGFPWHTVLGILLSLAAAILVIALLRRQVRSDPYSGPPMREGGLPTTDDAVAHFANRYHGMRHVMTVAQNALWPPQVTIRGIRPVEVRGPMEVGYGSQDQSLWRRFWNWILGKGTRARRNLPNWTPAWECTMSDNSVLYALQACANDVYAGNGLSALPETQVRAREGVQPVEPHVQAWPEVTRIEPTPELSVPDQVREYREVRIQGPNRFVLLPPEGDGRSIIDVDVLGGILRLGIDDGNVVARTSDGSRVIGRIVNRSTTSEASANEEDTDADRRPDPAPKEAPTS
jgi:hypothetical protein